MSLEIDAVYPSKYLAANDLGGRPRVVIITGAAREILGQGDQAAEKIVLSLASANGVPMTKKFVVGRMVASSIADLLGSRNAEAWKGKKLELRPESTNVRGKLTPCIRPYLPTLPVGNSTSSAWDDVEDDDPTLHIKGA